MAQLSKILGSILRDMVWAQHEANMYALRLSSAYRKQNQVAFLNPPVAGLGETELVLHCGFTGEAVTDGIFEIDQTGLTRTLQKLSSEIAEEAVDCVLSTIIRQKGEYAEGDGPLARLNREKTLRRNFIGFLSQQLYTCLTTHWAEFIDLDGGIDYGMLQECILLVTDEKFLGHSDLEYIFIEDASGEMRSTIGRNLQENIRDMLPRKLKDVRFGRQARTTSMDVTVAAEELSKFPVTCIQTFRIKVSPRNLSTETDAG